MSGQIIDFNAPSLQGKLPKHAEDLPHGLLPPPEAVKQLVATIEIDQLSGPGLHSVADLPDAVLGEHCVEVHRLHTASPRTRHTPASRKQIHRPASTERRPHRHTKDVPERPE